MNMPGFSAEASLYKTAGHYQIAKHAPDLPTKMIGAFYPAMKHEVITIRDCRPGFVGVGEGENMICLPDPRVFDGGGGGGRGPRDPFGGGDGGGPVDDDESGTRKMDAFCVDAAVACFPTGSHISKCAHLRCQRNYCHSINPKTRKPFHECNEDEWKKSKKAKSEYDQSQCDLAPCVSRR